MDRTFRYVSEADTIKMDIRMRDVVPVFEELYRIIASGEGSTHARVRLVYPPVTDGRGTGRPWSHDLRVLPAIVPGMGTACRLGATAHGTGGGGVALLYWDFETMTLRCMISDHLVHGVRSAAPDGPLAKYLAREDSAVLGAIGTGRIARWGVEAACSQRPIKTVRVYSRDDAHRREFCAYIGERLGVETINCTSNDAACEGADIIVMATATRQAVINGDAIKPGCTVISNTPEELDHTTVRRADKIVVTTVEDIIGHMPPWQGVQDLLDNGELTPDDVSCGIGDIIVGRRPGRTSDDEIIVGVNPGNGIHDVAAGKFVYDRAVALGLGTELPV